MNSALRTQLRKADGRNEQPSAAIVDSQSVKTTDVEGERGYDAAKKVKGRKRHILVVQMGLLLMVLVHPANIQDRDGAKLLFWRIKPYFSRLQLIWADGAYSGKLIEWVLIHCGEVMVGWSSGDPQRVYLAYMVTDDIIKDTNPPNDQWWNDDSCEIIFDFMNNGTNTKFVVGATGELGATSTPDNTEFAIVSGPNNQYTYEVAVTGIAGFQAAEGGIVGLSPIYNDCENDVREHQLDWIAGAANDNANQGDIIFSGEVTTSTEPSGKLAAVWGVLKR